MNRARIFHIIAVFAVIISSASVFAAENTSIATIVAKPPAGRTIYWKAWSGPLAINIPSTPTYTIPFGVDIPVKNGDYIEVTFVGNVWGNGTVQTTVLQGAEWVDGMVNGWYGWDRHPYIWRPFSIKSIYRAGADGTARFRPVINKAYSNDSSFKVREMAAFAEIIKPPVKSP